MDVVEAITAIGNAVKGVTDIALPYVNEHFEQLYEKEHKDRMGQFGEIFSITDPIQRADKLNEFVLRTLQSAGSTAGGVSGNISVPMDVFQQLVNTASLKIKEDEQLARIQFKENK